MDAVAHEITDRRVDHALPVEGSPAGEAVAHDLHVEMRLAFRAVAGMADMIGGLVPDHEVPRGEAVSQPPPELGADNAQHASYPGPDAPPVAPPEHPAVRRVNSDAKGSVRRVFGKAQPQNQKEKQHRTLFASSTVTFA